MPCCAYPQPLAFQSRAMNFKVRGNNAYAFSAHARVCSCCCDFGVLRPPDSHRPGQDYCRERNRLHQSALCDVKCARAYERSRQWQEGRLYRQRSMHKDLSSVRSASSCRALRPHYGLAFRADDRASRHNRRREFGDLRSDYSDLVLPQLPRYGTGLGCEGWSSVLIWSYTSLQTQLWAPS